MNSEKKTKMILVVGDGSHAIRLINEQTSATLAEMKFLSVADCDRVERMLDIARQWIVEPEHIAR